jgi:hypothetical protein
VAKATKRMVQASVEDFLLTEKDFLILMRFASKLMNAAVQPSKCCACRPVTREGNAGALLCNQSPWCSRLGTPDRFGAFTLARRRSLVNRACKPGGTSRGG